MHALGSPKKNARDRKTSHFTGRDCWWKDSYPDWYDENLPPSTSISYAASGYICGWLSISWCLKFLDAHAAIIGNSISTQFFRYLPSLELGIQVNNAKQVYPNIGNQPQTSTRHVRMYPWLMAKGHLHPYILFGYTIGICILKHITVYNLKTYYTRKELTQKNTSPCNFEQT